MPKSPRIVKETDGVFYDLYVCRINNKNEFINSKPCSDCIKYIKKTKNIKHIYYTDNDGSFIRENALSIENDHKCASRSKIR
uniref:CMP/dCMP-type deaminase domain-containing protein n=1 Tax=viral metagenome TaxID=1070528 RepID=A0A6C0JAJ1_9ZZZZ